MTTTCDICARAQRPDDWARAACRPCTDRLRAMLRELPGHLPLLEASLVPGARPAEGRHGGTGRAHPPLPARGDVLTLLGPAAPGTVRDPHGDQTGPTPIHALLTTWTRTLATDRGLPVLAAPGTIPVLATRLSAHMEWIAHQPWAADLHTELDELLRQVRRITHTRPARRPCRAPCRCGAWALTAQDWAEYIECGICGRLYTRTEYQLWAATAMSTLARTALALHLQEHAEPN
ncbi:hypothetical protein [Streptomyces uncialis]|uniref:hypothetical protein n=1 Tax=Streptomyces uncialis TaxID=1048205 RepID=UPI0022564F89|nr:hypothetical protein [Streptomyces uncialis]MCX4661485.1 hypothetical protein [Streptomyces uncialis]